LPPPWIFGVMRDVMPSPFRFVWYLVGCLLVISGPPLGAAEKKHKAPDTLLSPDGRFRVKLTIGTSSEGARELAAALVDARSGDELLELNSTGAPWIDQGAHALWSPDSRRLAFVTPSRRGNWTDFIVHRGDKWETVNLPEVPDFKWPGHREESKTILAAFTALRWLKPNVLLLRNQVEDADGIRCSVLFALTFDDQNQITMKRVAK
jgi:hypothetical protein